MSLETVELHDHAFYIHMRSTDRRVRQDAYRAIVGTYQKYRNTAAALLNGAVQSHILTVKSRGYESCLQAALFGGNIPIEVYNTLVSTVNENLPLLHRYMDIRKRALKLEDGVHAYDLFAPLVTGVELDWEYEKAVDLIVAALEPLVSTRGSAAIDNITPLAVGVSSITRQRARAVRTAFSKSKAPAATRAGYSPKLCPVTQSASTPMAQSEW